MTPSPDAPTQVPPPSGRRHVPTGAIVLIVLGSILAVIALAPLLGGGFLLWANGTQRDHDGYFTTSTERFETATPAITSERIDLGSDREKPGGMSFGDTTVRLQVQSTGQQPAFVGIARQADVDRYLSGVAHAELRNIRVQPFAAEYRYVDGSNSVTPPGEETIWVRSAEGTGLQSIDWKLESGRWALVVMNADGSPGVSVNASAGAKAPWVFGVGLGLTLGGLALGIIGSALLVVGIVALARGSELDLTVSGPSGAAPIRLQGRLTQPLSRWLWLVKWVLLIPHIIVLLALWLAFGLVTFIAFFAILFTGRYPRSLFEFNAGVLRWTWRVTYYGYGALGTDAYPPFSLGHHPDYPATFEIDYPEHLSRGLVLIKWWLLAIPHYLVLGFLTGGAFATTRWAWGSVSVPFGGLIGLMVIFAGLALLFTGAYPRGIHDFVMGMNRWVYRVVPYVALMRDEYPPFRLDQGPAEPAPPAPPPPGDAGRTAEELTPEDALAGDRGAT
ncbi:MAG: DUF4389 domain-containing protein [Acidimicrobiales bacterium]